MTVFWKLVKIRSYKGCITTELISGAIDSATSNNSNECMNFCNWLFNHGLNFQDYVCNGCYDLIMLCLNISDFIVRLYFNVLDVCGYI